MLWGLLSNRWFQVGIVFFVLCVGGSLLYSWHVHRTTAAEFGKTPLAVSSVENKQATSTAPVDFQSEGVVSTPDTTEALDNETEFADLADAFLPDEMGEVPTFETVQTSTNPLFADGVPEHLQPSEEWIGTYMSEASPEALASLRAIGFEVIEKYNPNRPIVDIWDTFMAAEKAYIANADPSKGTVGVGASRYDWLIQQSLDFPEIIQIFNKDMSRFYDMRLIELGFKDPDWNVQILPDGRAFRPADDYYYTVISRSGTEDNYRESRISFGFSGTGATPVTIDLANTSDAELERLGGWNYNINPYTSGLYQIGGNQ